MDTFLIDLVKRAAEGDKQCMHELILKVQPRVRAYIMRCTLNADLTEDLLQETMMQLIRSLSSLKDRQRIWPWLYRVASNKIASHFRKARTHSAVQFSALEEQVLDSALKDESFQEVSSRPALKELSSIVLKAIEKLNPHQRAVLSLRCFENMPYSDISETVGCTESAARVHFLRARKRLKSLLKQRGITGKAVLLALVLFGRQTGGDALASGITPTTVAFGTGMTALEIFWLTLQSNVIKIGAAAAVMMGGALVVNELQPEPLPSRDSVQSAHYVVQGVGLVSEKLDANSRREKGNTDSGGGYYTKGAYEQWLQFPEGVEGPVMVRMQRWSIDQTEKQCGWLQDGIANYYYHSGNNEIYMTNDPIGMLILPTDPPEMVDFILQHADYYDGIKHKHDRKTGLLRGKVDNRVPEIKNFETNYAYNTLSSLDFEHFWPTDARIIDERDCMHLRGWTYFTFKGKIGEVNISGKGMMPLIYASYHDHKPWLEISIGNVVEIVDTPAGAALRDLVSENVKYYPAGTFFTGLGRPWSGIRAYDTIRRDAAKLEIPFKAKRVEEDAMVVLSKQIDRTKLQLVYRLDMAEDLITEITFTRSGKDYCEGKLVFEYAQELEDWKIACVEPVLPERTEAISEGDGKYWAIWILEQTNAIKHLVAK